jgi:hypothetical protein
LVIVESDLLPLDEPRPDGLADGDVDDPEEPEPVDGVDIEPLLPEPEPVAPVLPEPVDPVLPQVLPPVLPPPVAPVLPPPVPPLPPEPPPAWAAASAGAKQTIPIKTMESIFFIAFLLVSGPERFSLATRGVSNIRAPERRAAAHTVRRRAMTWLTR